jgi:hypothetical protein
MTQCACQPLPLVQALVFLPEKPRALARGGLFERRQNPGDPDIAQSAPTAARRCPALKPLSIKPFPAATGPGT